MTDTYYITPVPEAGVFVRSGPGTEHDKIASVFPGDLLLTAPDNQSQIGQQGAWIAIYYPDGIRGYQLGYLAAWLVEELDSEQPLLVRTIESKAQRLRSGPGTQHPAAGFLFPEEQCQVVGDPVTMRARLGTAGEWLELTTPDGTRGFAAAWRLVEVGRKPRPTLPDLPADEPDDDEEPVPVADPVKEEPSEERRATHAVFPHGHALVGLHGPADPGAWPWDEDAPYEIITRAGIKAVKVHAWGDIDHRAVDRLKEAGVTFIMARLFGKFNEPRTPEDFLAESADATRRLFDAGVRYFEIHNEPNLHHAGGPEGMWVAWQNGREFGEFFLRCVELMKAEYGDEILCGWPGISPGPQASINPGEPPVRYDSATFLDEAEAAIRQADFVCMHTYWGADGTTYDLSIEKVRAYCERFPEQVIMVSEFSNTAPWVDKATKAREYVDFYRAAAESLPSNCGALFSYIMQASSGFEHEIWRDTAIPAIVGQR
ncbi:MAG: hypothetical protein GYB64_00625 [Chloroflexi bacterium]|nr:hypothetical protein [Chloroflexota bacterium]